MGESAIRTITLVNSGNLPLSISSVSVPTGFMCDFSGAIPVGGSNEVTVTFEPAARGPFDGKLTLNCDATSGATNYFISGTGEAGPLSQSPSWNTLARWRPGVMCRWI